MGGGAFFSKLTGCSCGNRQNIDFNKYFNVVVEVNGDNVSVVGMNEYSDYQGTQIQFFTNDGLRVLSSTHQTQLLKVESQERLDAYTYLLSGKEEENIIYYDSLQGTSAAIDYSSQLFDKNIFDLHFTYNKAIILTDETAIIVELESWKDYEDDKIQLKLTNGICILTEIDKVKLVNDEEASWDSLRNYAITLVGTKEKVIFYNRDNVKEQVK